MNELLTETENLTGIRRINVVGSSGSGKSTVGRMIAERMNLPYVELDAIFWKPGWTESTDEELFTNLELALESDEWVLDGNYSKTNPIKWRRVEAIVWLDMPYWQILYQVITRTLRRSITGEELWNGNRETLRKAFFDRESIILWSLTHLSEVRSRYLAAMRDPQYRHIRFVRICSRAQLEKFLGNLRPG